MPAWPHDYQDREFVIRSGAVGPVTTANYKQLVNPEEFGMLDTAASPTGQHRDFDTCISHPFHLSWLMEGASCHRVRCINIHKYLGARLDTG